MSLIILRNILSCPIYCRSIHGPKWLQFHEYVDGAACFLSFHCPEHYQIRFSLLSKEKPSNLPFVETPRDLPNQDVFLHITWFPCVVLRICSIGSTHSAQTSLNFSMKFSVGWSVSFHIPLTTSTNTGWMALWEKKIIIFLLFFHFVFHRGEKPQSRQNQSCPK